MVNLIFVLMTTLGATISRQVSGADLQKDTILTQPMFKPKQIYPKRKSGLKSPRKKKFFFVLILPYKTWWKPRILMD